MGLASGHGIRSAWRGDPALLWWGNVELRVSSFKQNGDAEDKPGPWQAGADAGVIPDL